MLFPNYSSLLFYIVLMKIVGIFFAIFLAELLVIFEYLNVILQWNYGLQ